MEAVPRMAGTGKELIVSWTLRLVRQTLLLSVIFWGCKFLVEALGIPVPANVLGIIVLFTLLLSGIVKEDHVSLAASFLLQHLVFFFIPIAVGLMNWGEVFYSYGWVLLAAIVISSLVPLLCVPLLFLLFHKKGDA